MYIYICEYVCIETHKHTYMACLLQNDMNSIIKDLHYYKIKDNDNRNMKQRENDDQEKGGIEVLFFKGFYIIVEWLLDSTLK